MSSRLSAIGAWIRSHRVQLFIFAAAFLVFFFRRPDALTNAQFWAEDAKWFAEAYNSGYSLFTFTDPYAGYLTLIQRIVGWFSGFFPLEFSPLVFSICALSIQALVLVYLWSKRTDFISKEMKVFISFVYLCLPYTQEIHANVTNSQWFLALIVFLILFMRESGSWIVRFIDRALIVVGGLSGPFAIFLSPIVAIEAWRKKKIPLKYWLLWGCAVVQLGFLFFTRESGEANMGYSVTTFLEIVGGQIFGSGLFGQESLAFFLEKPWVAPVIALAGIQIFIYIFLKADIILRYFLLFGIFVFAAALVSTLGTPPDFTWWYFFTTEGFGGRYYFLLHLGVFIALGWLVGTKLKTHLLLRGGAFVILALSFTIGVPKDFVYPAYIDLEYRKHIRLFKQLPRGTPYGVPVNPGEFWHATVIKR